MTDEQYENLKAVISEQIKLTVNGKIDKLSYEYKLNNEKFDEYIKRDDEWKALAQPVVNMGNQAKGFSVVILWVAGAIFTLGGAFEIIKKLLK